MKFESFISFPSQYTVESGIVCNNRELIIGLEYG